MTDLFLSILNMSLSASWLVAAVVLLRLVLKKAPRWLHVVLWGLVAVRLLCPFTLESALSLIPSAEVIPADIALSPAPAIQTGIEAVNNAVNPVIQESFTPEPAASANPLQILLAVAANVWFIGAVLMGLYALFSYLRLRNHVKMAIRVQENIYLSEYVDSPFVLGVFRPRIYLPYHMGETDQRHVIAHERTHIRRKDHLWKPLGYVLLTVHWFNPLMWLAYVLLCRDIELACDEQVIGNLAAEQRADYSQALLNCSAHRSLIAACPVAFGEVGVKARVKNVLNYKKPGFWLMAAAITASIIVALCFLTDPKTELPFVGKPVTYGVTLDSESPDTTGMMELNQQELSQLATLLTELDSISPYTGTEYDNYRYRFFLRFYPEDSDLVEVYVYDWDKGPVVLNYLETLYEIRDSAFMDFLLSLYDRGFILPAQGENNGIQFEITDVTATGLRLYTTFPEHTEDMYLLNDSNYRLEWYDRGAWTVVEDLPESAGYRINTLDHPKQEGQPCDLSWVTRYGELPGGTYRLLNDYILISDGNPIRYTVSENFTIPDENVDSQELFSILYHLNLEEAHAQASFASGGGYGFFNDEAQELASILSKIQKSELINAPAMNPILTVTLHTNATLLLDYDGTYVRFGFESSSGMAPLAVKNETLNEFLDSIYSQSLTYEIYDRVPIDELPKHYTMEAAVIDKVVVLLDGDALYNHDVFAEFVEAVNRREQAQVRIADYSSENSTVKIFDLTGGGEAFGVDQYYLGSNACSMYGYLYLRKFTLTGTPEDNWDAKDVYLLTDHPSASYEEITSGTLTMNTGDPITYYTVYSDMYFYPDTPVIPEPAKAVLSDHGTEYAVLTDSAALKSLHSLLSAAEGIGYYPKTPLFGPTLTITGKNGETLDILLDLDGDLIDIDGVCYDYGPGYTDVGGINAQPQLLQLFGMSQWPEDIRNAYPHIFAGSAAYHSTIFLVLLPDGCTLENAKVDAWLPGWQYRKIEDSQALTILTFLDGLQLTVTDESIPELEDSQYILHIGYDIGQEFDLCDIGGGKFYLRDFSTGTVYTFQFTELSETIAAILADS